MRKLHKGERFGMLEIIGPAPDYIEKNGYHRDQYMVRCDCGVVKPIQGRFLTRKTNPTQSCGCLREKVVHEKKMSHGEAGGKIVGKRTQLYRCWSNIKSRCYNQNVRSYADYGAKGIKMCDEWLHDFSAFANWARANGFQDGLTINRKDPCKDYEPDNCEWITLSENSRKARPHRLCEGINLETGEIIRFLNIREFAKEHGLSYSAIDQVLYQHNKTHKNWTFRYVA